MTPSSRLDPRPFRVLGIQQVAIGGPSKARLRTLWVDTLGLEVTGQFRSVRENVDEDICALGGGAAPGRGRPDGADRSGRQAGGAHDAAEPRRPVDRRPAARGRLADAQGVRFAPGGIRKGAAGHDICFVHPKGSDEFPVGGEGVLIELVQAPAEVIAAFGTLAARVSSHARPASRHPRSPSRPPDSMDPMTVREILKMGDPRLLRIARPVEAFGTPSSTRWSPTCSRPCTRPTAPAWRRRRSASTCSW